MCYQAAARLSFLTLRLHTTTKFVSFNSLMLLLAQVRRVLIGVHWTQLIPRRVVDPTLDNCALLL